MEDEPGSTATGPETASANRFGRDTLIIDVLEAHPGAAEVLRRFSLPCDTCVVAETETLEGGARLNGLDVERILSALHTLAPREGDGPATDR